MKISYTWLKEYLKTELNPETLGEILTDIGLELEGMETVESIKGGLKGIVIGEVLTCAKHPNADKLSVTTVDVGDGSPLHIVCGAPNVAAGQKVLVAKEGAEVFGKDGSAFTIKKGNIRGEASEGMICAEDELGLGTSHDGIMVLPATASVGMNAAEYYQVQSDQVFEIGLTPNRSDATNHIGVARDLFAAIKYRNLDQHASFKLPETFESLMTGEDKRLKVAVENIADCPRYSGMIFENLKVEESPEWLKTRLLAIDQRPINNIVDITNFILHETGQPLHAFDLDKIEGAGIKVKNLPEGTLFITLDGIERKLSQNDLMICDANSKPLCMAGVFGGQESGVTEQTTRIFLESAHFGASTIRKTSTKHLLRTEAAKCFEKGSDPEATVVALRRAASLLADIAGDIAGETLIDIYPEPIQRKKVKIHYHKINDLIGIEITPDQIKNILQLLDMNIIVEEKDNLTITIPTNKTDVLREVDVIEEIFRIHGLNEIPMDNRLSYSYNSGIFPDPMVVKSNTAKMLASIGFHEIMSVSLTQSSYFEKTMPFPKEDLVFINNTGNVHLDVMRPTMLISGFEALVHNLNRQQHNQQNQFRFFEFGRVYSKCEGKIIEKDQLALFMTGNRWPESWTNTDKSKLTFADIRSNIEFVLKKAGLSGFQETPFSNEYISDGIQWHRGPLVLAYAGKIKPSITRQMDIKQDVWSGIVEWNQLLKLAGKQSLHVTEINKFPSVRRDLALIVEKSVKFSDIAKIANKVAKPLLKEMNLFDVYENNQQIGETKKSYAVSFIFEQMNGTLKDEEVEQLIQKVRKNCEEQLGAFVRQ